MRPFGAIKAHFAVPFASADGRRVVYASVLNNLGSWIRVAALTAYFSASDALALLAFFIAARQALQILAQPLIGVYVDRYPKLPILWSSLVCAAVLNFGVAALVLRGDSVSLYLAFGIALLATLSNVVHSVFMMASIAQLFAKDDRPAVNSLLGSISTTALMLGPAVAGLMLTFAGPELVLVADAVMFLVAAALVSQIKHQALRTVAASTSSQGSILSRLASELKEGLAFLVEKPRLLALTALGTASLAGVGATWVLNPSVVASLGFDNAYIGYVMSVIGFGSVLGMLAGGFVKERYFLTACFVGIAAFAVCLLLWGFDYLASSLANLFVPAFAMGFFANVHEASYWSYLQNNVPAAYIGRVFSAVDSITLTGMLIGSLVGGYYIESHGLKAGVSAVFFLMSALWIAAAVAISLVRLGARSSRPASSDERNI